MRSGCASCEDGNVCSNVLSQAILAEAPAGSRPAGETQSEAGLLLVGGPVFLAGGTIRGTAHIPTFPALALHSAWTYGAIRPGGALSGRPPGPKRRFRRLAGRPPLRLARNGCCGCRHFRVTCRPEAGLRPPDLGRADHAPARMSALRKADDDLGGGSQLDACPEALASPAEALVRMKRQLGPKRSRLLGGTGPFAQFAHAQSLYGTFKGLFRSTMP